MHANVCVRGCGGKLSIDNQVCTKLSINHNRNRNDQLIDCFD